MCRNQNEGNSFHHPTNVGTNEFEYAITLPFIG